MKTVNSKDGTTIAFDQAGRGPALILVGGAFEQRAWESETAKLATHPLLSQHFTVYHYDRRGRGDSTDTLPFSLQREIEDIEALIDEAGGSAYIFGISSGAALAMEAALALPNKIKKLAMYEPPYNSEKSARESWKEYRKNLKRVLAEGHKGDAVGLFMMLVGMPPEQLEGMQQHSLWPMWEAIAPTLEYDAEALGEEADVPTERAARVKVPALIMDGSQSFPFMHHTAKALAEVMTHGENRTLVGQTHEVSAEVLAPVLVEFFEA